MCQLHSIWTDFSRTHCLSAVSNLFDIGCTLKFCLVPKVHEVHIIPLTGNIDESMEF